MIRVIMMIVVELPMREVMISITMVPLMARMVMTMIMRMMM